MSEQNLHDRVTKLEVLLDQQEKTDTRHEGEFTTLENKINAYFKKMDLSNIEQATMKQSIKSIQDWLNGKKNRNWAILSIILGQCLVWIGTLIFGNG